MRSFREGPSQPKGANEKAASDETAAGCAWEWAAYQAGHQFMFRRAITTPPYYSQSRRRKNHHRPTEATTITALDSQKPHSVLMPG